MDIRAIIIGIAFVILGAYAHGSELSGSCDSTNIQCELSMSELELCNDSSKTENYNAYFNGAAASWFNVIPNKFSLEAGECENLRVFAVANCYASPGKYTAQLLVQNGKTVSATCSVELGQGHFVDVDVQPSKQEATQCEEKTYDIVVTNRTKVPNQNTERADLGIEGIPKAWYTLESARVIVAKGEPETVKLKVKAPCDADLGTYDFKVKASLPNPDFFSEDGAQYTISQGQGTQIILGSGFEGGKYSACLETGSEGKIRIANNGKLDEKYKISLEGANFAKLDRTELSVKAGSEDTFTVKFSQTGEPGGNYDFKVKAESTGFKYDITKTFSGQLKDCYNLEVEKTGGDASVCVEDKPVYKFTLKNNREKPVELEAIITGIDAALDKKKFTINPGSEEQLNALIDVSKLAKEAKVSKTDTAIEILIDASGSMVETSGKQGKMDAAKSAVINLVNNISQVDLGLRIFGQGELCEDSSLLVPIKELDIAGITDKVSAFKPKGKTPLAQALQAAANDFTGTKQKAVILVSDGKETCAGNTAQAAKDLSSKGIRVYAVGFDIDKEGKAQLQVIADRTKGKYFDAQNSQQLIDVLKQISQELDIVPATKGAKTFTLKLTSEHFSFEKDFTLTVSDCHSAAFVVPELNICPGVEKKELFTVFNLGSERQEFKISYAPPWVSGPGAISVEAGEEKAVPFSATAPKGSAENKFSVKAKSARLDFTQEKNINYLSSSSCFAIDILLPNPELDAATCEGIKQSLLVENRGVASQDVTITADKPFVYIVDKKINIEAGEKEEVDFFVSPPFDLPATTFITINAQTDNGFSTSAKIRLLVKGNQESYGPGEVDVRVQDISIKEIEGMPYEFQVDFNIFNDSNRTLEILSAKALDFNGIVQAEKRVVASKESTKARLLVKLPQGAGESATVPISLETNEGTFTRNVTFKNIAGENKQQAAENLNVGTGLFGLASFSTAILGVLILLVIGLIAFSTYRAVGKEEGKTEATAEKSEKKKAKKKTQ